MISEAGSLTRGTRDSISEMQKNQLSNRIVELTKPNSVIARAPHSKGACLITVELHVYCSVAKNKQDNFGILSRLTISKMIVLSELLHF